MGKDSLEAWVVSSLPPPAAPLFASPSFLSEQAASTEKQPVFFQIAGRGPHLWVDRQGEQGTTDPTLHSLISWLPCFLHTANIMHLTGVF